MGGTYLGEYCVVRAASIEMKSIDKEFLVNMREFVQRVYEYRPHEDVEAGDMPYNTCDYFAMEEYIKEIDKKIKQLDEVKHDHQKCSKLKKRQ